MSLILSGTDGLSDIDGTAATPAIRGTDANTGIFFGTDIIGFSEGGVEAARINADSQFVAAAGTAALPVITTTGDLNTGIFFPAADTIAFTEGGSEAMRIDSSGNVGIGTASPSYPLDIRTTSGGGFGVSLSGGTTITTAQGTTTNVDMNFVTKGTGLYIFTQGSTERMRIDSSGNLLVGTTVTPTGATGGAGFIAESSSRRTLLVASTSTSAIALAAFINPNGTVGTIQTSGSATSYVTSSDYRLKNTIAPMTGALAKVTLLKPCTYKWNIDNSSSQGFIAHELQEVVPDCVTGEKDAVETYTDKDGNEATRPAYQGIDTSFLVATLTAAIQEQQILITALTARIETLENKT